MLEVSINQPKGKNLLMQEMQKTFFNPVFMCIGTDKVFADSLGPRVGSLLNDRLTSPLFVYGLCNNNITAENLTCSYNFIKAMHPSSQIVVIDSAVGTQGQIGKVQICNGGIIPGAATNKKLPLVGDVSIVGIVADKGMADFYTTCNEKLQLVSNIANFIADCILQYKQQPVQA